MLANPPHPRQRRKALRHEPTPTTLEAPFSETEHRRRQRHKLREGERVRITAQLIDARRDAQLWGQRYDRPLENVFTLQAETPRAIAAAPEVGHVEQQWAHRNPPTDLTAWDL